MRLALLLTAMSLAAATRYPVTGIVLKVDRPHRSFEASCAAIPGYMEAMAMPYAVLEEQQLGRAVYRCWRRPTPRCSRAMPCRTSP